MEQTVGELVSEIFKLKNKISQFKRGLKTARTKSQKQYWENSIEKFYDELQQKENILSDSSAKICMGEAQDTSDLKPNKLGDAPSV